jgi:hypothetical protein
MVVVVLGLGAVIAITNFYLSFLRYPICRMRGCPFTWKSGVPLLGSVLLVFGAFLAQSRPALFWLCLAVALIDTGGPHWFVGTMLWNRYQKRLVRGRCR